ncbi:MAG: hypothetical protein OZ948_11470 [Deltaproteobacteria bacterium]|nr:hypothetical protein [Deltaproteobacteria bacterium]
MLHRLRRPSLLLAVLLLALPAGARVPHRPDALGPYAVGHDSFEAYDAARNRTLPVHVWYPVAPGRAQGPPTVYSILFLGLESEVAIEDAPIARRGFFPLVVFSHGNGGIAIQSYFLTEALASHGFVVVAPDHVGDTFLDAFLGNLDAEALLQSAQDRPRDVSFLIDWMLARNLDRNDRFRHALNPFAIGVTGHSFGGFTALAVAAGFDGDAADDFGVEVPEGFEPYPADPRVRAIVPIAPASTPLSDRELERIRVPTLLVGGTLDETTPLVPEITRPYEILRTRELYRADLVGAAHFSFTNVCDVIELVAEAGFPPDLVTDTLGGAYEEGCAPDLMPVAEAHRLTNLVTVSFLRRFLAGDLRYQRYLVPGRLWAREPDLDLFRRPPRVPWWPWMRSSHRAGPRRW